MEQTNLCKGAYHCRCVPLSVFANIEKVYIISYVVARSEGINELILVKKKG